MKKIAVISKSAMSAFHRLPAEKLSVGPNQHLSYSKVAPTTPAASNNAFTFVCVAGLGETRYTFRHLAPLLAQAGHTVYMVDLRGMGDSSTTFSSYSVEDNTSDLEALLVTIGGKVVLVGNSFAAACIVLVKSSNVVGSMILGPFVRDMPGVGAKIFSVIAPLMFARPYGVGMWMSYWKTLFSAQAPDFDEYANYLKSKMQEEGRLHALRQLLKASKANAGNHLGEYKLPILIGMGSLDPDFSSPEAEAQYIHDTIGSTVKQVVMYPNVKHYPQTECPDAVAADLIKFLDRL
ncbi:unnamed protein product [Aphanomyces euteiches]|uniref:AB hydrolase-1 domain-containing protein n=1 Tax=Aphanomyces euteiches TaxID=100861 RepID=A0A6G0XRK4_9STRA|nr:hypothetical protein Ae201684_002155 [Aphanomyces euteiches]KAH9086858.1 hypothetical protein Ae201684P_000276 [Aphanomyces euteiches]KAH9132406.1 hypothetical protein AeRB84_021164 [Aphanomyces euteiches]